MTYDDAELIRSLYSNIQQSFPYNIVLQQRKEKEPLVLKDSAMHKYIRGLLE